MVIGSNIWTPNNIKSNDIVSYRDKLCLVAHNDKYSFPYLIIDLETGEVLDTYKTLEYVELDCKFICSSSDVKLVRIQEVEND